MTKWADFVVSAIKKGSGLANISHVQIHEDLEHGFGSPKLIDKYQLSSKIQKGLTFVTVHKKNENEWAVGELIRTYVKDGEAYIRTDDNKVDGDNLGHMPTVDELDLVFKEIKKEEPKPIPTPKPTPPPEPEPVVETPSPKINPNDGDFEYEDSKRKSLAEEAEKSRSNKSMPKGWSEKPTEKEIISDEIKELKKKSKQNVSREKEFSDYEQKYLEKFEKGKSKSDKLKEKLKQAYPEKSDEEIEELYIKAATSNLQSGQGANMAHSAAMAAVQTALETYGAQQVVGGTQKALAGKIPGNPFHLGNLFKTSIYSGILGLLIVSTSYATVSHSIKALEHAVDALYT